MAELLFLEDSSNISKLVLLGSINVLQAQEQKRAVKNGKFIQVVRGGYLANDPKDKKWKFPSMAIARGMVMKKDCWQEGKTQCLSAQAHTKELQK